METISLDTAIIITGISKRTLWRRIAEKIITRHGRDSRGRATVNFDDIKPLICIPTNDDDIELIRKSDIGNAEAQNELGQMFAAAEKFEAATYWLRASADQDFPDAMQNLGACYIAGKGVQKDENLGIMWIAKAASCGHTIALKQIKSLRPFGTL